MEFNGEALGFKIEDHRPFYSIIVPVYNPRKYLDRLFFSIKNQFLKNDIEVIISDDHSTEDYSDILDRYKDDVYIRCVQTDYNFGPGNTRERGCQYITGEWLLFIDQDDYFPDNCLKPCKDNIIRSGQQYYCISKFKEISEDTGEVLNDFQFTMNWNHGKFYNVDNLWRKYDIHFKKDLKSHEDIYICSCINCITNTEHIDILAIDRYTYIWVRNMESLTHKAYMDEAHKNGSFSYLETLFSDYLESTAGVYLDYFDKGKISADYALSNLAEIILYCYFYQMGFIFHNESGFIRENLDLERNLIDTVKTKFNITDNSTFFEYYARNDAAVYMDIQQSAEIATGPMIPYMTIMEFINFLSMSKPKQP